MGENGNLGKKCLLLVVNGVNSGRRSQESGVRRRRRKKKEEEGRRRKKKEVRKSKKISFSGSFACPGLLFGIYSTFPCTSTSLPML